LLYIHHIFGKSISAVMNIEVLPVAHVFKVLFVLKVVLIFKLLEVIIDPSIGLLFDADHHGKDSKIGKTGASFSYGGHFLLLCRG